jgi:hypothetical protein
MIGNWECDNARSRPSMQARSSDSRASSQCIMYLHAEKIMFPDSSLNSIPAPPDPSLKDPSIVSFSEPGGELTHGLSGAGVGLALVTIEGDSTTGRFPFKITSVVDSCTFRMDFM